MKIVLVEWTDAYSGCTSWIDRNNTEEMKIVRGFSAGLLYKETETEVSLVLSMNPAHYSQAITIPKGCITRIRTLEVKRCVR